MLQNKFNETQFQFFFLFIRRIFFLENSSKNKKKNQQNTAKKKYLPWNSIKKLNVIYMRCVFYLPLNHIDASFTCIL